MATKPAKKAFDFDVLRRGIEKRDAAAQLACYADDAEVRIVNKDSPPSKPNVLKGKKEIAAHLGEVCGADATHEVGNEVLAGDRAAFTVSCRYSNGARVFCSAVLHLREGKIARQIGVEAWDG